ncbi:MAG: hypothetical protein KGK07_13770 [Chloroflexota bacterium]|nr:hypothetical protein [Chloroflexota bacterium]
MRQAPPRTIAAALARALVLAAAGLALLPAAAGAQQPAVISSSTVNQSGKQLTVEIAAQGVHNLGAFQMVLSWDPAVVAFEKVSEAGFLGQSGRQPVCPSPVTAADAFRFACATIVTPRNALGTPVTGPGATPEAVPGVDGNGVLARAVFKIVGTGNPNFHLSRVKIVDPVGGAIASTTRDGTATSIDGGSSSSRRWIIIAAAAAAAVVLIAAGAGAIVLRRRGGPGAGGPGAEVPGP